MDLVNRRKEKKIEEKFSTGQAIWRPQDEDEPQAFASGPYNSRLRSPSPGTSPASSSPASTPSFGSYPSPYCEVEEIISPRHQVSLRSSYQRARPSNGAKRTRKLRPRDDKKIIRPSGPLSKPLLEEKTLSTYRDLKFQRRRNVIFCGGDNSSSCWGRIGFSIPVRGSFHFYYNQKKDPLINYGQLSGGTHLYVSVRNKREY